MDCSGALYSAGGRREVSTRPGTGPGPPFRVGGRSVRADRVCEPHSLPSLAASRLPLRTCLDVE